MAIFLHGRSLILRRNLFATGRKFQGYIVLVPEIGEDLPEKNPLLQQDGLPEFNHITIENCRAAIAKQTLDFEIGVRNIEQKLAEKPCTDIFGEVFEPLEELGTPLDMTWGLSKTLYLGNSSLMPTSSYIAIHDRARKARATKYHNVSIFKEVKTALNNKEATWSSEESRILQKFAIEGKLNGLELDNSNQQALINWLNKLNKERATFKQKTDISTKQFKHVITDNQVTRDFPEELLRYTAVDPNQPLHGPWTVTLQPHIYMGAMEYCSDRELRWNMWQAFVGRGSGYKERELATSLNLEEIRFIRRDVAKILGYETYGDMSMETKMAGSVDAVRHMLAALLERAKPAQDEELKQLYEFAAQRGFRGAEFELWDVPYWRRKQASTLFDYTESKLKQYFPLKTVLAGLFQLAEKLFNIRIVQRTNVSTWHKDVKFYDIFESHSSAPVAGFYLDPYARSEQKIRMQHQGWMVAIQNMSRITNRKPLAALIFNFDSPTQDAPCCLTFQEIKMLFQKFGHSLQHLLTRTNYSEVAGMSNIEWDAVEISGHVFSHWLLSRDVMRSISSHVDSEDPLPDTMYQSLLNVHQHLSGVDLCRELYLSDLDLELHTSKDFWLDIVKRLWPHYLSFKLHKIDSHPCSFTQIFSEEWGAAYYSHVWSRMVAADVYSAFHEVRDDEKQVLDVAKRYRDTFLALGGSMHPSQVFREFRGRDPSPKALLKSLGFKKIKIEES
ncbi:unnamed protein product [Acanthoscelides obtectus]|uniref:Peptidase M3A/M3B catalytic domain-containing protein n=1 Tax=Acanthoscelides obtectus TaxID=200917 RepID=A0A9P0PA18_ACAOB|nr:unnamed protein product [Acanthoscelides obtectus]CAK1653738.1 Probable cytosolic oligopeptidase A [Acanthoscelides obtectus]